MTNITDNKLLIYPNPASDILNIEFTGTETATMSIFNSTGQIVLSGNIQEGSASYDISNLSSGFYFIRVSNEYETYSRQIIKK